MECWQRLVLITVPLGLSAGTTKGLFLALGVCLACTGALTYCAPYASAADNRISAVANWALVAMLAWSFALRLDGELGLGLGLAGGAGDGWALGVVVLALEAVVAIAFLASCRSAVTAAADGDEDDVSGLFPQVNGNSSSSGGVATAATRRANSVANADAGSAHLGAASSAEGQTDGNGNGRKRLATARTAGVGAGDGKSPWERQRDAEVEKRERERVRKLEESAQQLTKENEALRAELAALSKVSRYPKTVDGGVGPATYSVVRRCAATIALLEANTHYDTTPPGVQSKLNRAHAPRPTPHVPRPRPRPRPTLVPDQDQDGDGAHEGPAAAWWYKAGRRRLRPGCHASGRGGCD